MQARGSREANQTPDDRVDQSGATAIEEAHALAAPAPRLYGLEKMKAFCVAGDKMHLAHIRKMWNAVRQAG